MTVEPFWHIGILVYELDAGIERFSELLGVTFNRVAADVDVVEDGGTAGSLHLEAAFSAEGPPFYELIQAQEGGIWGRQHGEGIHHVAVWQPEVDRRLEELRAKRATSEVLLRNPEGRLIAYLTPDSAHGTRIELVDARFKADFGF